MSSVNQRSLLPGEKIRVLVVDDSVVIRRLVANSLELDPTLELVGTASNGLIGMQRIEQLNPDVVTLDIEMPEMDGLEMLRRIRHDFPRTRVIMFSTLTERGAQKTLEALTLGADDYPQDQAVLPPARTEPRIGGIRSCVRLIGAFGGTGQARLPEDECAAQGGRDWRLHRGTDRSGNDAARAAG
jgi:CheY-like chemotaxis protein